MNDARKPAFLRRSGLRRRCRIEALLAAGAPRHCVLVDAGYGIDNVFRQHLGDLGLSYVVGITSALVVWSPGAEPLPLKPLWRHRPPACGTTLHTRPTTDEREGAGALSVTIRI